MSGSVGQVDVMAADITVSGDGAISAGVPHKLFQAAPNGLTAARNTWEVTPDGRRFMINSNQLEGPGAVTPLTVILNSAASRKFPVRLVWEFPYGVCTALVQTSPAV